jgi:branched-subunit amino acid aminotransferase/4-amino-4-deoxychorismate lyase
MVEDVDVSRRSSGWKATRRSPGRAPTRMWLGSSVFDGARAFEGVTPDLDRHCMRVNDSAAALGLKALKRWEEMVEITRTGSPASPRRRALHPPDVLGRAGRLFRGAAAARIDALLPVHLRDADARAAGFSVTLSRFRRPTRESAPVNAKTGCLYPNSARALMEAKRRASTMRWCSTPWAMSPSSPPPICCSSRTASFTRPIPTAPSSTASPVSA